MKRGFFSEAEVKSACGLTCKLNRSCSSSRMPVSGFGRSGIMIVGEAPGREEDEQGTQFVGSSGIRLTQELQVSGVHLHEECFKFNALSCRPPNNRKPTAAEIEACRPRVLDAIRQKSPKVVLLLGTSAVQSVIGSRWKKQLGSISRWRGWTIPDRELNCWLCPAWHPSYVMRCENAGGNDRYLVPRIWRQDIARALSKSSERLPNSKITVETASFVSPEYLLTKMDNDGRNVLAFDYETTGLKPDADGHEIYTVAYSYKPLHAEAFQLVPKFRKYWKAVLASSRIKKVAHSMKFEERWSRADLDAEVNGWEWDTMLTAHELDNRQGGVASLKFQAYVNFGVVGYDDDVQPFLQADTANARNRIKKAPLDRVLFYNGMDAALTFMLRSVQKKQLAERRSE